MVRGTSAVVATLVLIAVVILLLVTGSAAAENGDIAAAVCFYGRPLSEADKGLEQLPRIAYVYQIHALQQSVEKPPDEPIFYGDNVGQLLPTILHPNEILDGAIVRGYYCMGHQTYSIQNHPIVFHHVLTFQSLNVYLDIEELVFHSPKGFQLRA